MSKYEESECKKDECLEESIRNAKTGTVPMRILDVLVYGSLNNGSEVTLF